MVVHLGTQSLLVVRPRLFAPDSKPLYGNPPDWRETRLLKTVLRPGDLFVDVGANIGTYSLIASEVGASVLAIEAAAEVAQLLELNVALNRLEESMTVIRAAASDTTGSSVTLSEGLGTLNYVLEREPDPERESQRFFTRRVTGTQVVQTMRIDGLVGDRCVTAMKIDVEGQEAAVLAGCGRLLADQRIAYLQIENNEASLDLYDRENRPVWRLLTEAGYELYDIDSDGTLRVSNQDRPEGYDVVALAADSPVRSRLEAAGFLAT